ncbi:MAG: hypothetical protein Kow0074_21500 [Candidatus Zixiibacteriota bacterium]
MVIVADSDEIYRPSTTGSFDEHGLDRALAEAITQTSFDPTDATPPLDAPDSTNVKSVLQWRSHAPGECARDTVIGIDFSQTHVTLLEMAGTSEGKRITGLLVYDIESTDEAVTFADVLRAYGAPCGTRVHVSITSPRAVVRRFELPKVPRKQRVAAACWQARKLIPFPVSDEDSLHGFRFEALKDKGWMVTLAALPREDVGRALESVQSVGWKLESVSIAGTKKNANSCRVSNTSDHNVCATLLWSPQRSSFVVLRNCELWFHYDLGIVAAPDVIPGHSLQPEDAKRWIGSLRKAVGEAVEFYGGSNPQEPINRIELVGVPESIAPLITDWEERFGSPVVVTSALETNPPDAPDNVRAWFEQNRPLLIPAWLAITGEPTIDLTPSEVRQRRQSHKIEQVARSSLAVSIAGILVWSGLLWMQQTTAGREQAQIAREIESIETSPIIAQVQSCMVDMQRVTTISNGLNHAGTKWMPDVRRTLATLPQHARLRTISIVPDASIPSRPPVIRLEGLLHPTSRAHSLTYADWLRELKMQFGPQAVSLESTRDIEWKGSVKSAFVLSIHPGHSTTAQGGQS